MVGPVIHLAKLRLKEEHADLNTELLTFMKKINDEIRQGPSGIESRHFQEIEDPRIIYVMSEWKSMADHYEWLASPINVARKKDFEQYMELIGMVHVDVLLKDVIADAPILSVARLTIPKDKRDGFMEIWASKLKPLCQSFLTEGKLACGWKQEPTEEVDEFIILAPWKAVAQHMAVGDAPGGCGEEDFKRFMTGMDTKHVKRLHL